MGNLIGGPLDEWVQKQIKVRQESLANNSNAKNLLTNHNKTSWVKLVSSVTIGNEFKSTGPLGDVEKGNKLAKEYTLFSGINFNPLITKGGVVSSTEERNNIFTANKYSYGIGDSYQGYQPLPGLDSVKIRHLNRGAIRKFDIKLKAQNKFQFEILETLYLRLGYYMLLEWGHTNYLNNNGELISSPIYNTIVYNSFIEGIEDDNFIVEEIRKERVKTSGNYDGALFKVSNYSWNLESDGSYNISIEGISKGGIIGSLLFNYPKTKEDPENEFYNYNLILPQADNDQEKALKALGGSKEDNENLKDALRRVVGQKASEGKYKELADAKIAQPPDDYEDQIQIEPIFNKDANDSPLTILNQNKTKLNEELFKWYGELKNQDFLSKGKNKELKYKVNKNKSLLSLKFRNPNNPEDGYVFNYIRFKNLLDTFRSIFKTDDNNESIPIDNLDTSLDDTTNLDGNFMFTHWFQHSTDPTVCVIPFEWVEDNTRYASILNEVLAEFDTPFRDSKNFYKGNLMNIFVNLELIAKSLEDETNLESGEISFYEVFDKILFAIQKSLGGINSLYFTYADEVPPPFGLKIYDDTVIPDVNEIKEQQHIRLFGLQPHIEGSFVKNISTQSKVSSNLATQISIGATSSGVNNSTSLLSNWNKGLIDRVHLKSKENSEDTNDNTSNELQTKINKIYKKYLEFVNLTYVDFLTPSPTAVKTAQSNLKLLLEYDLGIKTINGNIAGKGFIPIDLSIEIEGMSGILMQQKINTSNPISENEILPYSYVNKIDFIVQSIDHTIQNNEWTTTINTLSVPKKRENKVTTSNDNNNWSLLRPISGSNP